MSIIIILLFIVILLIASTKKKILYREDKPYLIRYTIIKTKWFSLKIHKALMSDPADLHDHPWNYISLILWGGYFEVTKKGRPSYIQSRFYNKLSTHFREVAKWYKPLSVLYRRGDSPHKLIIPEGKYCISLILTFKKWRDWGFIKNGKWESHINNSY